MVQTMGISAYKENCVERILDICGGYGWIRTTDPIIMSDVL